VSRPKNIVLFGLSANPPTGEGGHAGIVRWAAQKPSFEAFDGQPADQVWVLPVYRHAFSSKQNMPEFGHRLAMARIAFQSEMPEVARKVRVLDVERTVVERAEGAPVGTVDVVRHVLKGHPERRLALLLGADTHRDLLQGRWKESEALRALVRIVGLPRLGVGGTPRLDGPLLSAVSSSQVRDSHDLGFLGAALQPRVLAYIRTHQLYAFASDG